MLKNGNLMGTKEKFRKGIRVISPQVSSPLQPCPTHCEEAKKICVNLENHSAGRSSQGSPTHKKVFLQKFDPKSEYLGEVVEIPFRVCGLKFGNIRYLNAGRDFGHFSLFK